MKNRLVLLENKDIETTDFDSELLLAERHGAQLVLRFSDPETLVTFRFAANKLGDPVEKYGRIQARRMLG